MFIVRVALEPSSSPLHLRLTLLLLGLLLSPACSPDGGTPPPTGFGSTATPATPTPTPTAPDWDRDDDGHEANSDGGDDCNDANPGIYPGAVEQCDQVDEDCDRKIDEGAPATSYDDEDEDGYGGGEPHEGCPLPTGYVTTGGDCDDTNTDVNPGAEETCHAGDDDCDGSIDEGVSLTFYQDQDSDGWGGEVSAEACEPPEGYVATGGDCDDFGSAIHPEVPEVCDGVDQDCDVSTDEGVLTPYYADGDGDGYGHPQSPPSGACTQPAGFAPTNDDCDDSDATIHPGGGEQGNGRDDDCDSAIDEVAGPPSCVDALAAGVTTDGVIVIDPDGLGGSPELSVYCNQTLDGGGWQLISARTHYQDALFGDALCLDPTVDCSGSIPGAQARDDIGPDVLFTTSDGQSWVRLTGLLPPNGNGLASLLSFRGVLTASNSCSAPHYCNIAQDPHLSVAMTSGFGPRHTTLTTQYARFGGLWFGEGGGNPANHMVSLNYATYCGAGGLDLSSNATSGAPDVACGAGGGIWFRY